MYTQPKIDWLTVKIILEDRKEEEEEEEKIICAAKYKTSVTWNF